MAPALTYIQLTHMYAPSWGYGGPVRLMYDYAKWMSGISNVAVFSGDLHHDFTRILQEDQPLPVSLRRHRIYFRKLASKSIYLVSPALFLATVKLIRRAPGRVIIHVAELRGLVPLYALLLKQMFNDKVVLVHSAFGMLHEKSAIHRTVYDFLFMKRFLKAVGIRLAQNQHEQDAYDHLYRNYRLSHHDGATVVLPLHADSTKCEWHRMSSRGKERNEVAKLRRKYRVPEAIPVFIFLGRFHPEKGILRLIDTFCQFRLLSRSEAMLLIVGRDDGFQHRVEHYIVEKLIGDYVRVINNVYESRYDYYFLADVFLGFPTIFEETMLASIEALSCGTPIIVSREADIPFVEVEGAGQVIDFEVDKAVQALQLILRNLSMCEMNARATFERHFQAGPTENHLVQLLQEVAANTSTQLGQASGREETVALHSLEN